LHNPVARGLLCAVLKLRTFTKFWLPVVLWAVIIFSASGDKKSVHHSSRIIEPIVRWLVPDISDEAVRTTVLLVRKTAHLVEYAVLAMLLSRGLRHTVWKEANGWSRPVVLGAWLGATLYAVSDEIHQSYVPGRQGSAWDVLIDSIGAAGGLAMLWLIGCGWNKWKRQLKSGQTANTKES